MVDAVVVGGGPAGSATALLLARAGLQVTLVERQQFPRAKPCGDCISPAANSVLRRLGLWDDVLRAAPAHLHGWRLTSPGGASFHSRFADITPAPDHAASLAISRDRFDAVLLHAAERAGVRVLQGVRVVDVLRSGNGTITGISGRRHNAPLEVRARLTIGADGLRSVVARRLHAYSRAPRLRKTSFTMHVPLENADGLGEMRLGARSCLGVAPVESSSGRCTHNVTLVLERGSYDARYGARSIVENALRIFRLEHVPIADEILTSGPFDWPVRHTVFPGAALVGDAAGYYDPFTGQGIYQALASAELLVQHRDDLSEYARRQRMLSDAARRVQRLIEFVCARPRLADRIFRKLASDVVLAGTLIGVTGDLLPARSLLSLRMLARLAK